MEGWIGCGGMDGMWRDGWGVEGMDGWMDGV